MRPEPRTTVGALATAVSFALLLPLGGPSSIASAVHAEIGPRDGPDTGSNTTVVIDPASWWMESGENATFATTWVGTPAGCALEPIWFRWAIAPGGSEGALGPTDGPQTTFFASDQGTGTSTIIVHAAASLRCHGNVTAAFAQASASVTVAAPLTVRDLIVGPNPIAPGASTDLVGSVLGGDPPYRLRVAWGDGNVSYANASGPGPFSIPHVYGSNDSFEPELLATDAAGRLADDSPEEPAYVNAGFAAAIVPSTPIAEVGIPATFAVATTAPPQSFSSVFACEDALPAGTGNSTGMVYGCAFCSPGVAPVTFEAVASSTPFAMATATLEEGVVPPPSLEFPVTPPPGEVDRTTYAAIELAGGVPPFAVDWSLVGTGSSGVAVVPSDGVDYLPLDSTEAGTLVLSVVVVDALGGTSTGAAEELVFDPALEASATAVAAVVAGVVALNVSASVAEGAPPFDWTVVAQRPAANASPDAGALAAAGAFAWNATYRAEGSLPVTVAVVDADGASATVNLSVLLVPELSVFVGIGPSSDSVVTLTLTISGGVGPFTYRWNDTAGDVGNATEPGVGTFTLREATSASGSCSFDVLVTDALGATASSQARGNLSSGTSSPPVPTSAWGLVVIALALTATVLAAMFLRRRRPVDAPPPPDPVAVLREAIEPSDGVDRGLVELMAEERGVPLEVVRTTLERLKAEGTVRAGRGSDGEEVLAWSETPSP